MDSTIQLLWTVTCLWLSYVSPIYSPPQPAHLITKIGNVYISTSSFQTIVRRCLANQNGILTFLCFRRQDWKKGNFRSFNWNDGSDTSDKSSVTDIRQNMVLVSTSSNIVSKMTAFVAIDVQAQKPVEGEMVKRPCPIPVATEEFAMGDRFFYINEQEPQIRSCRSVVSCCVREQGAKPLTEVVSRPRMMDSYYECFFKGDEDFQHAESFDSLCCDQDFQSADCVRDCYAPAIEEDREPKIVHTYCQNPLLMGTEIQKPLKDMQEKKLTSEYVQPQCQVSDKADSRATRKKKSGFWPFSKLGRLFSRDREKKDKRRFSAPPVMDVSTSLDKQNTHEKPLYARTESPGASSSLKKQENYGNKMLEMIRLQHIDGHWALTQAVTALLGVKDDVIKSFKMEKEADVITTLAVIVWLRSKFGDKHDEWEMIEQKALTWLCSKTGQEKSLEDLLEKIKRHLWPRGL